MGKHRYKLAPSPDFKPGSYSITNKKIKSILDIAKEEDERKEAALRAKQKRTASPSQHSPAKISSAKLVSPATSKHVSPVSEKEKVDDVSSFESLTEFMDSDRDDSI